MPKLSIFWVYTMCMLLEVLWKLLWRTNYKACSLNSFSQHALYAWFLSRVQPLGMLQLDYADWTMLQPSLLTVYECNAFHEHLN